MIKKNKLGNKKGIISAPNPPNTNNGQTVIYKPKQKSRTKDILIEFTNPTLSYPTQDDTIILPFSLHYDKFKINYKQIIKRNNEEPPISVHDLEYIVDCVSISSYYKLQDINKKKNGFLCCSVLILMFFILPFYFIIQHLWQEKLIDPIILIIIVIVLVVIFFSCLSNTLIHFEKNFFENREKDFNRLIGFIDSEMLMRRSIRIEVGKYGSYLRIEPVETHYLNTEEVAIKRSQAAINLKI